MADSYRPVLSRKAAQAIFNVLKTGLEHIELSREDAKLVLSFMNKISEREQIAAYLSRFGQQLPDLDEAESAPPIPTLSEEKIVNLFIDWEDEALDHFLISHPDDEQSVYVQQEITRRTRERESNVKPIRPPSN